MKILFNVSSLINRTDIYPTSQVVHGYATKLVLFASLLTVIFNGGVFLIVMMKKRELQKLLHVLYLCTTDMFVGVASLSMSQVGKYSGQQTIFEECAPYFAAYLITQCATLYHIFAIAIHRFCVIRQVRAETIEKFKHAYYLPAIWFLCIVLNMIPFLQWGKFGMIMNECSLNSLFTTKYKSAMFMFSSAYYCPLLLTNIFYTVIYITLRKAVNKVGTQTNIATNATDTNGSSNALSYGAPALNGMLQDTFRRERKLDHQRSALVTIGLLLLLLNISASPLIISIYIESNVPSVKLTRTLKFLLVAVMLVNSLLNPFVYIVRFTAVRNQLKAVLLNGARLCNRVLPI